MSHHYQKEYIRKAKEQSIGAKLEHKNFRSLLDPYRRPHTALPLCAPLPLCSVVFSYSHSLFRSIYSILGTITPPIGPGKVLPLTTSKIRQSVFHDSLVITFWQTVAELFDSLLAGPILSTVMQCSITFRS